MSSTAAFESEKFKLQGKFPVYCHTVQAVLEQYHRPGAPLFIKVRERDGGGTRKQSGCMYHSHSPV